MTWTLTLRELLPTLNEWERTNEFARVRLKKRLATDLFYLARAAGIPKALGPRVVTVTRVGRNAVDEDGLAASAKALLDALVRCEILIDDRPKFCSYRPQWRQARAEETPHTIIEIQDRDA